jgi:methyl-accepting chemotaxis protein
VNPSPRSTSLPSARELRLLVLKLESIVAFPALAVVLVYMSTLVDLGAREWRFLALASALYGGACVFAVEPLRRRMQAPLRRLAGVGPESPAEPEEWRAAFACVIRLPREMMRLTLACWIAAGPVICLLMSAMGFDAWLREERVFGVAMAALAGGLSTMSFSYFAIKRGLAGLRERIVAEIPDAAERRSLVAPITLTRKLQYAVAGAGVASLILTVVVAYDGARQALVEVGAGEQHRALAVLADRVAAAVDGAAAETGLWSDPRLAPQQLSLAVYSLEALPAGWEAVGRSESGTRMLGNELLSWRQLPAGRVAVASTRSQALLAGLGRLRVLLVGMLVVASALCFGLSWMVAEDVRCSVAVLREDADRIAGGDLRPGSPIAPDDELADLAGAFARMRDSLRAPVVRMSALAERLDAAVLEIETVGRGVTSSSADQGRRVREAAQLMERIGEESGGVTRLAQVLGESVEESSSSILELGATGDELSDTAGVLSERIDDVSASIEEMIRSVKQVGMTTQGLSEAASDTSSSMEEMASAMRAIDTTAAKTAVLASDVVESSESGLRKVRETIDGMQSIRDATDDAERVIRGLGERTKEIGAILDVIDDVGDETTLLALNAAIIAAQAGEHGRAFSVVADEIKELADRVLSSTKEIGELIRSVQAEAGNAVGAIEAGSKRVSVGVHLAAEAGVSLEDITRSAAESGQHIQRIVEAVREQTGAATHVAQLMDRVSAGVDEIRSAGADQDRANEFVYRSAVTMREISQQVRRTTEEQSRGFARIRENVEGVRESVEQIDGSLRQQSTACEQVTLFLEIVDENTHSNEQAVQRMDSAMEGLSREAEVLREEVGHFEV